MTDVDAREAATRLIAWQTVNSGELPAHEAVVKDAYIVARALLDACEWRGIESAPVTVPHEPIQVLVWGPGIGVRSGSLHRWRDGAAATVNVSHLGGDAVANWGVTHWQPLPAPPARTEGRK